MRQRTCTMLFGLIIVVAATARPSSGVDPKMPLDLPLFPVPIVQENVPLAKALSEVAVNVTQGYVLFGIELRLDNDKEPVVNLNVKEGSTIGDALHEIFSQLPNYRFTVVSAHLINVFPREALGDASDPLNIHVARFDVLNEDPWGIISRPEDFIPQLRARLKLPQRAFGGIGIGQVVGQKTTIHLRDVTIRQILNAASEATEKYPPDSSPLGWVWSFKPNPALPNGGVYSWTFHQSAPYRWEKPK